MMRRFEMLKGMHMGPMKMCINTGDVLTWDVSTKTLILNGKQLEQAKGMDFEEVIDILDRQILKDPQNPWAKELTAVGANKLNLEVNTGSQVVLPILGCLQAAEEFLGKHKGWESIKRQVVWTPTNEEQYQFLQRFLEAKSVVDSLGDNLRRKADLSSEVINAWLKENGFDITLKPNTGNSFCVASILDVLVEWVKAGDVTSIYNDKGTFPAVKLKAGDEDVVRFMDKDIHQFPIAGINTKSGDRVRMTVLDFMDKGTFSISDKVEQLRKATVGKNMGSCDGVIFPMIDYDRMVDINWIQGMSTGPNKDDFYIAEALQQTKFRMNEKGARAQSAVAMTLRCKCAAPKDNWIRIDRPFILWIERPRISVPLFIGVFAEDVWKKPADLK